MAPLNSLSRNDAWLRTLGRRGWAWEFLRRSALYRGSFSSHGITQADANRWGLLRYENPDCDARTAAAFWRADESPSVLPLTVAPEDTLGIPFVLDRVVCRVDYCQHDDGTDILFSDDGRFLQLSIFATADLKGAHLCMPALDLPENITARAAAFRRFNDLIQHGRLRPNLYPREPRAPRLITVLRALDGSLAGLPHREIAMLIFSKDRVDADWGGRQHHLRDQVRRAIAYGQGLMNGGYRQFLRPTYSRQIARPGAPRG